MDINHVYAVIIWNRHCDIPRSYATPCKYLTLLKLDGTTQKLNLIVN